MKFEFETEDASFADFAAGHVFYSAPNHPAFPVRLGSEIFQRCLRAWRTGVPRQRCVLYDPCCGSGYQLATLGLRHWGSLEAVIGSDVSEEALALARRNLSLLTTEGMARRTGELEALYAAYGKDSHRAAIASAQALAARMAQNLTTHQVSQAVFIADATDAGALRGQLGRGSVDIVVTDVPYGIQTGWSGEKPGPASPTDPAPAWQLLDALLGVISPGGVVAVSADKGQRIAHEAYRRIDHFRAGKRQVVILTPEGQRS